MDSVDDEDRCTMKMVQLVLLVFRDRPLVLELELPAARVYDLDRSFWKKPGLSPDLVTSFPGRT